jgi:diketogulonate reductase-like aldo/keto reductase
MERRQLGPTGERVPVIGQGTWQMERDDPDACIAALRRGLDLGLTHIDTAELYGDGLVEERIVSLAIAGRRDEVFLTSKVLPHNASLQGTVRACEQSLRRLRTDRLDLYLLHWRGPHHLADTFTAFERLVADGKIRHFGVSNFDADELELAVQMAGAGKLACNQVLYHLRERAIEHAVLPTCERERMALVGYSPFGSGSGSLPAARTRTGAVLAEIAGAHRVTAHAVALAFLVRHPGTFAIPKASRLEHVEANAAAGELRLTAEEVAKINTAFPRGPQPEELPAL